MKKRYVNTLLIFTLFVTATFASVRPVRAGALNQITTPEEMEAFLDGVFASEMATEHFPGAVVVVVKDGQVFFSKGYGYANIAEQLPVSPDRTLFRIGSTSKLFVWTSVMQLVEQGKIDLEADINTYLDFQIPATYPEPITMKNLMTHTPGFEESNLGLFAYSPEQMTPLDDFLEKHIPARIFPPGEVAAYSNYGAALAGYIVERVSGLPFDQYVEENIFQPLSMSHITFHQPLPAELSTDMATGYDYTDSKYTPASFELINPYPAGSVSATADDMAKFMIANLQNGSYNGTQILSEATAKQMHSMLDNYDPRLESGFAYGFFREIINGQLVLDHGGDTSFFHTGFYFLPDQNIGIFFSTNSQGGAKARANIFKSFMNHYFPAPVTTPPTPPADMAARASQYSGNYWASRSNMTGLEKINNLNVYKVSVDDDGYVVMASDTTKRFVEIEPGLLQNVEYPSQRLALKTDANGQTVLISSYPWVYIKAAWYQSPALHFWILGLCTFLLTATLIGWTISFVKGLIKRQPRPLLQRAARFFGVLFVILLAVFFVSFLAELSNADPVSGVPMFFMEAPNHMAQVLMIPQIMAGVVVIITCFMALAWVKRFWNFGGRFNYLLLTISAWLMIFELFLWNFLKLPLLY